MAKADLTAQRLRELLDYDPDTGMLTWKHTSGRKRAGAHAGWLDPHGYRMMNLKTFGVRAAYHRFVWFYVHGTWPVGLIDHINGDPSDNRIANLRDVTALENSQNLRRAQRRNKSGFLGVATSVKGGFCTQIIHNKKYKYIGFFKTPEEAHEAYLKAKRELHVGCTI